MKKRSLPGRHVQRNRLFKPTCLETLSYCATVLQVRSGVNARLTRALAMFTSKSPSRSWISRTSYAVFSVKKRDGRQLNSPR